MLKVVEIRLRRAELSTRMPFRYGIATLTDLPHVFAVAEIVFDKQRQIGVAADHLPPKWFTKDPERNPLDEIEDMLAVIRHATGLAKGKTFDHAFAFWQHLDFHQASWGEGQGIPPLLYRFGTALIERAVIDAICRALNQPFWRLLRENAFGIILGRIHPLLADDQPADWLPSEPLDRLYVRHTVGLSDPLLDSELKEDERLADGLPQSLESCIRAYGLYQFKIKVTAHGETSVDRLRQVLRVIQNTVQGRFSYSLDGNESFSSVEQFRNFWDALERDHEVRKALPFLLFVEQPFHRDRALGSEVGKALRAWELRPLLIIDESDGSPACLRTALESGYHGVSHKNCKGIFKGVANACLLAKRRKAGKPGLMSGEDLANVGPVAVCQDLAVQAALGNASVERNGHHYFCGLNMWPNEVGKKMVRQHPELYRTGVNDVRHLIIRDGKIDLASVNAAPLGVAPIFTNLGEAL
jgi:L-alanine-DL-glutamate epimerase-like enolase superfamily enzyme